jgi:UDP-glucose 4-epimerase
MSDTLGNRMNVLVTGGAGLIGMPLRKTLAEKGHGVTAIDVTDFGRDDPGLEIMSITDNAALADLFARKAFDAVIHCGAISGPMMARGEPMTFVEVNIGGTALLLDLARRHRLRRFVFCSSISVYGNVGNADITEDTPLRPTSVYAASKVAGEQLLQAFSAEYGLRGVSLRIGRVYGPYRRGNCHLARLIHDAAAGGTTEIPCDLEFRYHYVYVDDVVAAQIAALTAGALSFCAYNVGSGEALTMPQIAAIARAAIPGANPALVAGADDVPDVQTTFDVSRIAADLAWRPRFDLASGLKAYQMALPHSLPSTRGGS